MNTASTSTLMDTTAVATYLGVTASAVRTRRAEGHMPPPVTRLGGSPVWSRDDIETWAPGGKAPRQQRSDRGKTRAPYKTRRVSVLI